MPQRTIYRWGGRSTKAMIYHDGDPEVQRVRYEVRRFKQHLITYIAVVGALFLINVATGGFWYGHWWFFWIALIWGVFLALQAVQLFGDHLGQDWEDRMVSRVMASRRRTAAAPGSYRPPEPPRAYTPPPPPPSSGTPGAASASHVGDARQEPIVTPPPSTPSDVRQEPIATPPPASTDESAGPGGAPPKLPEA